MPAARVCCHYLDLYRAVQARAIAQGEAANLSIECSADFPAGPFDVVALPLAASGEAELTRDLLQQGHERLPAEGLLVATSDNPRDTWLHGEMQKLFRHVTRRAAAGGVAYLARKDAPLRKLKQFGCEFVFRDRERLIRAFTRPGVFAHRRVDPGARQLMQALELVPGERVLDIGCGSGTVSLAAAVRLEGVQVHAVDSNARAVECTLRGAELNGLTNIAVELNSSGEYPEPGTYDLALANPPYYANFQIARQFLLSALVALRPGGRILAVTKSPGWYAENMLEWFADVAIDESKGYYLARGRKLA